MDYGRPMKPFSLKSRIFGLGQTNWTDNSEEVGVFSAKIPTPILVQWVTCPCFPLFNHYFYKKLSIPNIYLVLGFEFGPKENRDLAFVCPLFVLWEYSQSSDIHEVVKGKSRDFVPAWLGNYIRNVITYFDLAILILRMLNEAFFSLKSSTFGHGQTIWANRFWGHFGYFQPKLSTPISVQWVTCPCFPLFNHYFYKKLSIPNIYLVLGFEFGPKENRDLAFVCPLFVLWEYSQSSDIHEVVKGKSRDFVPARLGNYIRNVIILIWPHDITPSSFIPDSRMYCQKTI